MDDVGLQETILRMVSAAVCGGVLGWERESNDKPAGLRTNMLVSLGAAAAVLATLDLVGQVGSAGTASVTADPVRIIDGVIGGLGFLGAGAIIQSQGRVQGMTTAATIWVVGGIGVACGLGSYSIAFAAVAIAFAVLYVVGKFERSSVAPAAVQKDDDGRESS